MTKFYGLISTLIFIPALSEANDIQRKIFESNNTIMNFTLASSAIKDVLNYLNKPDITINKNGHEHAEICFKNKQDTIRLTFITGVLHDYKTLYGFELSESEYNDNKNCEYSDKITSNISTKGGISLLASKSEMIKILGDNLKEENKSLTWKFDFHNTYKTPIHKSWRAGPTDNKYTQHQTIKGEYHTGYITAKFDSSRLVSFRIIDYAEADFEIKNEYDSKSPFAAASLKCFGGPYVFIVSYSTTGNIENYTLIKQDGSLFHQGKVDDLTSFSISWPDKDASVNNKVSFFVEWNKNNFSGSAKSSIGNIIFNGQKYNSSCMWDRKN